MEKNLDDEVEKTLRALEGITRAEPRPFLYTRLKARMEQYAEPMGQIRWRLRQAYLVASLALLVGLNVGAVIYYTQHQKHSVRNQPSIDNVVSDYGLSLSVDIQ